jgi:carbamoyl-phosphate synthase large subunit
MTTVLVTGVGAIIGYGIIKSLRQSVIPMRIIGMDIYAENYGKHIADKFYQAKRADSEEYDSFMRELIAKENIDLILTGIEQDLYRLHQLKHNIPTKIVMNNDLLIGLSKDKLLTYNYFKSNSSLNLIPTLTDCDFEKCARDLGLPFLIKPRSSYASKGLYIVDNESDFKFFDSLNNHNNVYQKLVGSNEAEYTISIFGDGSGSFFDYIILRRQLAQTGATDKAEVVEQDDQIMQYIETICKITKPIGPTNIQLRTEGEQVYLLEINPRISSACSIRTAANYNEPEMCLKYYLLEQEIVPTKKQRIKSIRFIKDFFYE